MSVRFMENLQSNRLTGATNVGLASRLGNKPFPDFSEPPNPLPDYVRAQEKPNQREIPRRSNTYSHLRTASESTAVGSTAMNDLYVSTYKSAYGSAPFAQRSATTDSLVARAQPTEPRQMSEQLRDILKSREERRQRNEAPQKYQVMGPPRTIGPYAIPPAEINVGTDEFYMRKMEEILSEPTPSMFPSSPSRVTDFLYIGGYRDAENLPYLRRLGINHILNTAAMKRSQTNPYPPQSGIVGYESFDADDVENYDIMQHFPRAKAFIDRARWGGGKVLVHCAMGVNRSGALCCAYLMTDMNMNLLEAVRRMKQSRYTTLCNRGFRRLLLRFARAKGYLN